jgi:hypothetical protein
LPIPKLSNHHFIIKLFTEMKTNTTLAFVGMLSLVFLLACQKQTKETTLLSSKPGPANTASCLTYNVSLSRTFASGQTTFVWTITNPNPGNGSGTTLQDLSHWSFVPGCPGNNGLEQNWSDIIKAEYSYDNGATWTLISPTPVLAPDPSQTCSSANVFKFNVGTNGSTPTLYKLVVMGNYAQDNNNFAVFKSGGRTGCCTRTIPGIGCKSEQTCSYSQGYYFASPHAWPSPGTVTVGGFTYTEVEGRAIWNCSNAGGIPHSKQGFTQVAALKLSGAYPTGNASIDADVVLIETWLSSLGKLVACSNLPSGNSAVAQAAGRIGDWINANHCTE